MDAKAEWLLGMCRCHDFPIDMYCRRQYIKGNWSHRQATMLQPVTYQARIAAPAILDDVTDLLSRAERCLWAEMAKGRTPGDCKSDFIRRFGITARQFNAIAVAVKGKAESLREISKLRLKDLDARIKATTRTITRLRERLPKNSPKRRKSLAKIHQKARRLGILEARKRAVAAERRHPVPSLCFGSARLFSAQHHLKANGFPDHTAWREEWRAARSCQFFCLGSKDEAAGNQTCTASIDADGAIRLRLRLPNALASDGKYLAVGPVRFAYGHDVVAAAITAHTRDKGEALSWRFVRDEKGWRVFVSVFRQLADTGADFSRGCLAVDMNAGFLAAVFLDSAGNPKGRLTIPMPTQHRRHDQVGAAIGDAVARLVALAGRHQIPIVIDDLDFEAKKARIREEQSPGLARLLSAFVFSSFRSMLERRAARECVAVAAVDPAYTSLQGRCRFMERYGLSVHHAAAVVIGRRGMRHSERLPASLMVPAGDIPAAARRNVSRVTLRRPARNGARHVRENWAKVHGSWKAALRGLRPARRKAGSFPTPVAADERSLADDALFLSGPAFPPRAHDGAIPSRESSAELLGGRACAGLLRNEQIWAGL